MRRAAMLVLSLMLVFSMLGSAAAAPEPATEEELWQIIEATYPDMIERMNPRFEPLVQVSDEYSVIAFEVEPVDADKLPWFYYHLAVFQFQGRAIITATELEKETGSTLVATDLASGAVTREVVQCQKATSLQPPIAGVQVGEQPEYQPPEMCQVCARYESGGGYLDSECHAACSIGCALLSGGNAALCLAGCYAACWVPSWTICVEWVWVECSYPE